MEHKRQERRLSPSLRRLSGDVGDIDRGFTSVD